MNKLIKIPHGNTVSIGAVDACLQATNPESGAPFNSRHVLMQLAFLISQERIVKKLDQIEIKAQQWFDLIELKIKLNSND
jgi:hypothetical protein